jgi:hypothetical protein
VNSRTDSGNYNQRANDPLFWLKQARELDQAAMLIWTAIREDFLRMSRFAVGTSLDVTEVPSQGLGGVFWLNAGLALENLLKGIVIQDDPSSVVSGVIAKRLRTHNLVKLAKFASVPLDVQDAFYLYTAMRCVTWAGRYPSSIDANETKPPVFSEADVTRYKHLFNRLSNLFANPNSLVVTLHRLA